MRRIVALSVAGLVLAGCSTSAQDLPLPGSRVGGDTYTVEAVFDDALNLAEGAPVKLDGVTIGRVHDVKPVDFTAQVSLDVRASTRLHEGATARLRSTTPLGELFVQIDDAKPSAAPLRDGARLGPKDTSAAPTIEDTMTSASLLINGGGLGQLETIVREANLTLGGHEGTARDLMARLVTTAKAFDASHEDIGRTLDALADLSATLQERSDTIDAALRDIAPAAKVLRENTDELTTLLKRVDTFGDVAIDVVRTTRDDLLQTLREMAPVFDELNSLKDDLGPGIDTLVSFGKLIDRGVPTDYLNTFLHFHGNLTIGLPGTGPDAPNLELPDPLDPKAFRDKLTTPVLPQLLAPRTSSGDRPGLLGGLLGLFGGDR
ncbi:MCE family protein [Aeromicrobium terrae]|uniref:MCE family protein n=1 Tax=Aeromicrobium terrae TaxID=2498846 RepID=A0A5C8NHI2_9ACTN|nr:MCE family protein [Aeromicrobium terrae]TXL61269.1 MCE family protein [Aeromicrobium terrae]